MSKIRVTVWNEFRHERNNEGVRKIYPEGLHKAIGAGIACDDFEIRYATLDEPDHGLTDEVLDSTDVLIWWGHAAHAEVKDEIVAKAMEGTLVFFPIRAVGETVSHHVVGHPIKERLKQILYLIRRIRVIPINHDVILSIDVTKHLTDDVSLALSRLEANYGSVRACDVTRPVGGVIVVDIDGCLG